MAEEHNIADARSTNCTYMKTNPLKFKQRDVSIVAREYKLTHSYTPVYSRSNFSCKS